MRYPTIHMRTAIAIMAVLLSAVILGGCATTRQVNELKEQVAQVENNQAQMQASIKHMDSLITASSDADMKLRNELRYSVEELNQQIAMLLQNYNDLMQRIDALLQQPMTRRELRGSVGSETYVDTLRPGTPPTATEPPPINCDSTYDEGFILTRRTEYQKAIDAFEQFVQYCPEHPDVSNAYYWMGENYYGLQKYEDAVQQFQVVLDKYPNSSKASQALYKIARSREEQGKTADAKKLFQQVIDDFPGTFEAEQARVRLDELK
jgi:tol-pal system protein YbgF